MVSKYSPKRVDKLIDIKDIDEKIVKIKDSDDYYAGEKGNIYRRYSNNKYYFKKPNINTLNGYEYIGLEKNGLYRTFRVHRIIATTFIPNPNNYPVVGHKDNDKTNNAVENLYWTTYSENTQKAVSDGLLVNDKGYDDSQSHPVVVYDKDFIEIAHYGSMCEAHKATGVSKSTVARHCKGQIKTKTRSGYYFRFEGER